MSMSGVEGRLKKSAAAELQITSWKLRIDPNLAEDTNGTTLGVKTVTPIKMSYELSGELILNSGQTIEGLGLGAGVSVNIDLRIGTSPLGYMAWSFRIGATETTGMDPNGFARVSFSAQANIAPPTLATYA